MLHNNLMLQYPYKYTSDTLSFVNLLTLSQITRTSHIHRSVPDYSYFQIIPRLTPFSNVCQTTPILKLFSDYPHSKTRPRLLPFSNYSLTTSMHKIIPDYSPDKIRPRLLTTKVRPRLSFSDYKQFQATPILRLVPGYSHSQISPKLLPFSDQSQTTPILR